MAISRLSLTNFRSYRDMTVELSPQVTLVVGPNASGKTNLLESLYVLSTTKSFRAKDPDLIHHGEELYRIVAVNDDTEYALAYSHSPAASSKKVSHGGAKKSLARHIGLMPVVLFEPGDLDLVGGTPERRRRYLDGVLSQTDPTYLKYLSEYRRVLKQRNKLLDSDNRSYIEEQIFAWDIRMAELAAHIVEKRQELIDHINDMASGVYEAIAGASEQLGLVYQPSVEQPYADVFLAELGRRLLADMAAGFTTIGPHREDFDVVFKGSDINAVASRGEVRTVVLMLKQAELAYIGDRSGRSPLLLLDDVFSELDEQRRAFLVAKLRDHQTVITTTEADALDGELGDGLVTIRTDKHHART